ncbi:hypothetical protein [Methanobrevibacter sp.]|uniref:hypothetical protein n=1 Tax=Methanobrevibacter sp. TaxID=66852 RepID=UPI0038649BC9
MDKRWILILIILVVGGYWTFTVAESSTTVGDAITVVNKSVITLPDDFTIADSDKDSVDLIDKKDNRKIHIEDIGKGDLAYETFNREINSLSETSNIHLLKNSTLNAGNITIYKSDLENYTNDLKNVSIAYIYSSGHTFAIKFEGYPNENDLNKDLKFMVTTIAPDFKQAQD